MVEPKIMGTGVLTGTGECPVSDWPEFLVCISFFNIKNQIKAIFKQELRSAVILKIL